MKFKSRNELVNMRLTANQKRWINLVVYTSATQHNARDRAKILWVKKRIQDGDI